MEGQLCNDFIQCKKYLSCNNKGLCERNDLFPMDFLQILTYVLLPIFIGIANVGGIGGGVVKVPILVVILNFNAYQSTSIGYTVIFGTCLVNILSLIKQKHPSQEKPLIDYGIATILIPAILIGTITGRLINNIFPEICLTLFFILFLCYVCIYLLKRFFKMFKLEQQVRQQLKQINQDIILNSKQFMKNQKIEVKEIDNELEETNDLRQSSRFSIIDSKPKIQRFQTIVEQYNNEVISKNSDYFNKQELKFNRQKTMKKLQRQKVGNYQDFAKQLAEAQQRAQQAEKQLEIEKNKKQMEKVKEEATIQDIELQNVTVTKKQLSVVEEEQEISKLQSSDISIHKSQNSINNYKSDSSSSFSETNQDKNNILQEFNLQTQDTTSPSSICQESLLEKKNSILKQEQQIIPLQKFLFFICCFAIVTLFAFILNGSYFKIYSKCSIEYWLFQALQYTLLGFMSFFGFYLIKKEIKTKLNCNFEFDENDLKKMEKREYIQISLAGILSGIVAGNIGAGAGLVMVPILSNLGLNPRVPPATSSFSYFFISWTCCVQVFASNEMDMITLIWYVGLAIVGASLVSPMVYWTVNKFKRMSFLVFLVFILAFINIISSILYIQKQSLSNGFHHLSSFKDFCYVKL